MAVARGISALIGRALSRLSRAPDRVKAGGRPEGVGDHRAIVDGGAVPAREDIYRTLVETIPHGVGVLNARGEITLANRATHRIFGFQPGEMAGRPLYDLMVSKAGRIEIHDFIMAIAGRRRELATRICKCKTGDGRVIDVQIDWNYITGRGDAVTGLIAIFTDVTRRIEAESAVSVREQALRQSEKIAQAILNVSAETIALLDVDGTVLDINDIGARRLRKGKEEIIGRHLYDFIPRDTLAFRNREIREVMETGGTLRYEDARDRKTFDINIRPVRDEAGRLIHIAFFARDVTALLSLQKTIITISETERQDLGQNLHDDLGQHLTGISYMTAVLRDALRERGLPEADDAAAISEQIKIAIERLRKLSKGLSPVSIEKDGLADALHELCGDISRVFPVICSFEQDGDARVGDAFKAVNIFHIAQEAVNNALKHANPSSISIRAGSSQGLFCLSVKNDVRSGAEIPERIRGIGTDIMKYRANLIGGAVDFQRGPESFTVTLRLDLPALRDRED